MELKVRAQHMMDGRGRRRPPFFLTARDWEVLRRVMEGRRFDASIVLGAAARCRRGVPTVLTCAPLRGLRPFPTTFWLVCPWLDRRAGMAEAEGGVRRLEAWLADHALAEHRAYARLHQRIRLALLAPGQEAWLRRGHRALFDRLRRGGVGGIHAAWPEARVKCLHLQTASWLALGHHPGAELLDAWGLGGERGGAACPLACGGRAR